MRGEPLVCFAAIMFFCIQVGSADIESLNRCPFGRQLQQITDTDEDSPFGDLAEDVSVFQEVSANFNNVVSLATNTALQVTNITATIEMDTGPTFSDNFLIDNRQTWEAGQTRVNVSVTLQTTMGASNQAMLSVTTYTAQLHDRACIAAQTFDNNSLYYQTNASTDANFSLLISNGFAQNSTTLPYLIDYDSTQSMVILNQNGAAIACTPMVPPIPDFPTEWSATIESNIVNKGYSFTMTQYYSQPLNKVRLDVHSNGTDRVLIQDFASNTVTVLTEANSTYPHGYCSARQIPSFFANMSTADDSNLLLDTAQFLRFNANRYDTVFVPGHQSIRGIECEQWMQYSNNTANISAPAYNISFFFPVSQWLTAREDYHRLLKEIRLQGTRNNTNITHYYEYINFRADSQAAAVFDPCALAPKGTNCNCTTADLSALAASGHEQLLASSLDGVSIDPDATDCLGAASSSTKGFTHAQRGPYALFFLLGFAAGIVLAIAANFIWTTCAGRNADKMPSGSSLGGNVGKFQPFDSQTARG